MDPFDEKALPRPGGLMNTGVICHFNALLQALGSCSPFVRAVTAEKNYASRTATGRALYNYCRAVEESAKAQSFVIDTRHSSMVLAALMQDLRARRPEFSFGAGMESATEGIVLLLDMVEPPSSVAQAPAGWSAAVCDTDAAATAGQFTNPIAGVFQMRIRNQVVCMACSERPEVPPAAGLEPRNLPKGVVSRRMDTAYQYNFFHYDEVNCAANPISTPLQFTQALLRHYSRVEDFKCGECAKAAGLPEKAAKVAARAVFRTYDLRLIPPVLVILFNQYHNAKARYFPEKFRVLGKSSWLWYRQVAQIEHAGSLTSGHYWAIALKRGGEEPAPHLCNDMNCSPSKFGGTVNTYTVFYAFLEERPL